MPVGLLAGAEAGDGVDGVSLLEHECCAEGGAEGGEFFRVDDALGDAGCAEDCD